MLECVFFQGALTQDAKCIKSAWEINFTEHVYIEHNSY